MNRSALHPQWIIPDWPAPGSVRALITTRAGGVSSGAFGLPTTRAEGMNVGLKSGDDLAHVQANRALLRAALPAEPRWLSQVHGADVLAADDALASGSADASTSLTVGVVCAVTIADCLPVLLADARGRAVGAAHAGWRGLAGGVIQNTVAQIRARLSEPDAALIAYLGPAIGPLRFEVGAEVLDRMRERLPDADHAFAPAAPGKYFADLFLLARQALAQVGVSQAYGGGQCTASNPDRHYSFRRDRVTGRHVALIWIES